MWQHAELTVTNSPFGLTIKFYCIHRVELLNEQWQPVNIQSQRTLLKRRPLIKTILGDRSERVPPVPIPNTEVKPFSPDGTARASVWESRKLPN